MNLPVQLRTKLLLIALTGTGALAQTPAVEQTPAALPSRAPLGEAAGNLFEQRSWQPPPPPASSSPPPVPLPPPIAYRFAGAIVTAGQVQVLLAAGDRVFPVATGQDLGDGYRVESISANEIVLRYLPLGTEGRIQFHSTIVRQATH